nr:hypothetical protein [Riemerella anatipestifer]
MLYLLLSVGVIFSSLLGVGMLFEKLLGKLWEEKLSSAFFCRVYGIEFGMGGFSICSAYQ